MAQQISGNSGMPIVIKPKAYITMLKHVLTYGNEIIGRDKSVEVMGVCYGKEENGALVQYEAVPISHGSLIEVEFSPEDYSAFAIADEEYADKGLFAIGWYHSHPGHKAFFSKVDIQNHLSWQKEQTPHAYGIVFDHQYFDYENPDNPGFKVFRLDNFKQGINSGYHEVENVEIEPPEDFEHYLSIVEIIERQQAHKPIIKEAKEGMEGGGAWSIADFGTQEEEDDELEVPPFQAMREGYTEGLKALSDSLVNPLFKTIEAFTSEAEFAATKGADGMITALEALRDNVEAGMERVKRNLENELLGAIDNVTEENRTDMKEFFDKENQLFKKINQLTEGMTNQVQDAVQGGLDKNLNPITRSISKVVDLTGALGDKQTQFSTAVKQHGEQLQGFSSNIGSQIGELDSNVSGVLGSVKSAIDQNTETLRDLIAELSENHNNLEAEVKELSSIISSKR